ncbi:hypothetical protein NE237_003281 [Protea cynaroides]|uniref:Uncharacterized protein n=1 Tax=Protea cynaroides TaxID=273540 RepID=A0A9Q0QSG1_9MAGN|nr:hypothetical protein NE237_003281 [Protea cynaroides]
MLSCTVLQWMTVGQGINRGLYLWINLASNNKMLIQFEPLFLCADYDGARFITIQDGVWKIDSIPAVLGVTRDPFIVLTSNLFAILGLRSLYVLISQSMSELELFAGDSSSFST